MNSCVPCDFENSDKSAKDDEGWLAVSKMNKNMKSSRRSHGKNVWTCNGRIVRGIWHVRTKTSLMCACAALILLAVSHQPASAADFELNEVGAREILKKSADALKSLKSYKTTSISDTPWGQTVTMDYFRKELDGTAFRRLETKNIIGKKGRIITSVRIFNRDGEWELIGKNALLLKYDDEMKKDVAKVMADMPPPPQDIGEPKLTIEQIVYNNQSCYKIAEDFSPAQLDYFKQGQQRALSQKALSLIGVQKFDANLPVKVVYIINQKDLFAISKTSYLKNGDVLSSFIYTEVSLNIPLADDLFSPPSNLTKTTVYSYAEYIRLKLKEKPSVK